VGGGDIRTRDGNGNRGEVRGEGGWGGEGGGGWRSVRTVPVVLFCRALSF
jgi:hypothetical protein